MQHGNLTQVCTRVVAGMFIGVLIAAAPGVFADEASNFNQNAVVSTPAGSNSLPLPNLQGMSSASVAQASPSPLTPVAASAASMLSSSTPADAAPAASADSGGARGFLSGMAGKAGDVVVGALNMIGVRYRWGGNSPDSGLDCSGFVRYVFQDTLGLALPRRAEEMSRVGEKVSLNDLKPGDLVFFNTMRRTFSHVGIYIGDNKFVHSPSTGSTIRVDDLDESYWEKHFTGARRIEVSYKGSQDLRQRVKASLDGLGN
jgi:cell wall-associated NlpC family hydrolase